MLRKPLIWLDTFGASGGVGRSTRELLCALADLGEEIQYCGMSHVADSMRQALADVAGIRYVNLERPRTRFSALNLSLHRRLLPNSRKTSDLWLQTARKRTSLPSEGGRVIVNYPQVLPPPRRESGFPIQIHDLNWLVYPGNFQAPDQTNAWCRGWVQQASLIFTNSETTRHEVIRQYECAPDRVVAAPYAPIRILCKQSCFSESPVAGLQEGHFYLYPSAWALHKGFRTLTEALEMAEHIDPVVVTCGDPLSGIEGAVPGVAALRRELEPRWRKLVATGRLKIFSYMPDQQMLWLSRKCKALILPSDYEGYGLPLAEAVYHHRPAIVSSIPAHCEILDRYPQYRLATLFQPGAAEELALCLNRSEAETSPETTGWAEEIDSTWSWMHTAGRILAALG